MFGLGVERRRTRTIPVVTREIGVLDPYLDASVTVAVLLVKKRCYIFCFARPESVTWTIGRVVVSMDSFRFLGGCFI